MNDSIFLDTNILVYSYENSGDQRCTRARELILSCFRGERGFVISNQILAEFFWVITHKCKFPITKNEARNLVHFLIESIFWTKVDYTTTTMIGAMRLAEEYHLSIWDALIAATMLEHHINTIYTENEADFSKVPGLQVINPFKSNT